MAKVVLEKIQKKFGTKEILKNIYLTVEDGQFIVILGPSGCGKSTLLRIIAGLENCDQGTITIGQREVNKIPPKDRDIAMVFQNYALYPHMTVMQNMAYGLKMRGLSKKEINNQVHETAKILGLEEYLNHRPSQLSGGQRQRVAMGRAIVRHPAIFLFDEPLSNLDAKLRVQMRLEIKKLHQSLKATSLYVTHDQTEAMTLADQIVVLRNGNIEQIGPPLQVYRRPASLFVASFVGSPAMNFIKAQINANGSAVVIAEKFQLPIDFKVPIQFHNQNIILGLRPENINETANDDPAHFDINIDMMECLGSDTMVYGYIDQSNHAISARFHGQWLKEKMARNIKKVSVTVDPNSLHLFDPVTERRIVSED